jgi:hypothetical protein
MTMDGNRRRGKCEPKKAEEKINMKKMEEKGRIRMMTSVVLGARPIRLSIRLHCKESQAVPEYYSARAYMGHRALCSGPSCMLLPQTRL